MRLLGLLLAKTTSFPSAPLSWRSYEHSAVKCNTIQYHPMRRPGDPLIVGEGVEPSALYLCSTEDFPEAPPKANNGLWHGTLDYPRRVIQQRRGSGIANLQRPWRTGLERRRYGPGEP